jgi:hypothetical protein
MPSFCQHCNQLVCSIKDGEFVDSGMTSSFSSTLFHGVSYLVKQLWLDEISSTQSQTIQIH